MGPLSCPLPALPFWTTPPSPFLFSRYKKGNRTLGLAGTASCKTDRMSGTNPPTPPRPCQTPLQPSQGRRRVRGLVSQVASSLQSESVGRGREETFARSCPEFGECKARFQAAVSLVTLGQECIWNRKPAGRNAVSQHKALCGLKRTPQHTYTYDPPHSPPGHVSPHADMPEPSW